MIGADGALRSTEARFPNASALLAFAAVAFTSAAVSLVTLNRLKDAAIDAALRGPGISFRVLIAALGPLDAVLIALAVASTLLLLVLELRTRAVTSLLATMTNTEALAIVTILIAWLGHCYLGSGLLLGGDIATHISRFLEVARGLQAGRLAEWTNYQYLGAPLLWFTGPLMFVVGGGITYAVGDPTLAMKLLLFAMHVAGGLAFYALLRRLGFRGAPAILAAAGFAGSFAHLHLFLYRGVAPQALTMVFLVLLFFGADGLMRGRGPRWANAAIFALSTAAMIVNHQPHAPFAALYLAIFGAIALAAGFWTLRGAPVLVAAGVLGAVASIVAVAPILLEADGVMIEPAGAVFSFHWPTARRLLNLVIWRNGGTIWGSDYWAYLGLGLLTFGAAGVVALLRRGLPPGRRAIGLAACACLFVGLFVYNTVVRDVMFLLLFLGLLAAIGLEWLMARRILAGRVLLAAIALALLDLMSTSVQPVLRNDKGFLIEAGRRLEQTAPNQRVVQVFVGAGGTFSADIGPDGDPSTYAATFQRVAGNHNMGATRVHNFLGAAVKLAQSDLQLTGRLSAPTETLLAMFNVGRVICSTTTANGCPAAIAGLDDPVLGRFIPVPGTPALFSQSLVELTLPIAADKQILWAVGYDMLEHFAWIRALEAALHTFLDAAQPDIARATATALPIQQPAPPASPPTPGWRPAVTAYAVALDRVSMRVEANAPGWMQLAHPWFPSTLVTVNGVAARPLRGSLGLMVLPIGAGVSTIELREGGTGVRAASEAGSLAGLVGILILCGALARRDRTRGPG